MSKEIYASRENALLAMRERIGDSSRRNQQATNRFDEVVGDFMGLNRTDSRCLDIIDRSGRLSAGQLANASGLTTGAVTAVIDRLEQAGYVQRVRDGVDRRKVWVETTEETRAMVTEIFGFYDVIGPALTAPYSEEQLAGILDFLEIGTLLQDEMAAGLREHAPDARAGVATRIEQARRFRRAMDAGSARLLEELAERRRAMQR